MPTSLADRLPTLLARLLCLVGLHRAHAGERGAPGGRVGALMGKLGDAIKRAAEVLKDPNYVPPEPETLELPPEPDENAYTVTFLHRPAPPLPADRTEARLDGRACIRCGDELGPHRPVEAWSEQSAQIFECVDTEARAERCSASQLRTDGRHRDSRSIASISDCWTCIEKSARSRQLWDGPIGLLGSSKMVKRRGGLGAAHCHESRSRSSCGPPTTTTRSLRSSYVCELFGRA